ncbi:MAG: carbon-nitrogen hydrolase family protein [Chloroflexi bacterium]|nr:carbon-nitrogen hydrolase family protein [Chloroflexota bacterium]
MSKKVEVAVVQMIAEPAPVADRLARAENLIAQAAQAGAQLVVLPEVFNTGYEYTDDNYRLAEPMDGQTPNWMKKTATRHRVHLAGTFLRQQDGDIYNTCLLAAPDQRIWHYDKRYPWMWERAYFQPGKGITIADTDLGKIGMLICWDVAHPRLWQEYAGKVELMLVSSCPPAAQNMTLIFPDGRRVEFSELGPMMQLIKHNADETFGAHLRRQSSNLNVPVVHTTGTGLFRSKLPRPGISLASFLMSAPHLWKYLPQAEQVIVESRYFNETYIADASGNVLAQVQPEVESFALAEIEIPVTPPQPHGKQPVFGISILGYWSDAFANWAVTPLYQKKTHRI